MKQTFHRPSDRCGNLGLIQPTSSIHPPFATRYIRSRAHPIGYHNTNGFCFVCNAWVGPLYQRK